MCDLEAVILTITPCAKTSLQLLLNSHSRHWCTACKSSISKTTKHDENLYNGIYKKKSHQKM